jgi:hypothetical protein
MSFLTVEWKIGRMFLYRSGSAAVWRVREVRRQAKRVVLGFGDGAWRFGSSGLYSSAYSSVGIWMSVLT